MFPLRPLLLVWLAGLALAGCKPAEEPPRRAAAADAGSTWPGARDVGLPTPSGTIIMDAAATDVPPVVGELAVPDGPDAGASDATPGDTAADDAIDAIDTGAAPDAGAADTADTADTSPSTIASSIVLPDDLVAKVRTPASDQAQDDARRLNRVGLQKHRRLELDAAIHDYQQALEAWPGHAFANYNIACAYALTGRPDDALRHLAILAVVGDAQSRDRLLSARTDADFDAMLDDPRFREVTGYTPVYVSWSPGLDSKLEAQRLATALRGVHVAARATPTAWATGFARPTLLVRAGDAVAARAAAEVRAAINLGAIDQREDPTLDLRRTVVMVLPEPATAQPAPAPTPPPGDDGAHSDGPPPTTGPAPAIPADDGAVALRGDARTFADLVGVRLTSRNAGTVQKLILKPTGFFEWEIMTPDGGRTLRRGRYAVRGESLSLEYREDVQTPGADPAAPEVRFEEGKRSTHPFVLTPGGLTLDGSAFRLQ